MVRGRVAPGAWEYVASDKRPGGLRADPADSPKADVLTFIAGTAEAREACSTLGIRRPRRFAATRALI